MRSALVFNALRESYGIDQIRKPMTVAELRDILEDYNDDDLVILSHDNDYTFGSVGYHRTFEEIDGEWIEL